MSSFDKPLACPACGQINLHQEVVTVFERDEEDGAVFQVSVHEGGWCDIRNTSSRISGNPSIRRNAILIHFSCEHHGGMVVLNIYQHKGTTYQRWNVSEEALLATIEGGEA